MNPLNGTPAPSLLTPEEILKRLETSKEELIRDLCKEAAGTINSMMQQVAGGSGRRSSTAAILDTMKTSSERYTNIRTALADQQRKIQQEIDALLGTPAAPIPVSEQKGSGEAVRKCGRPSCSRTDDLARCVACRAILYCSKKCQVADWKRHKITCRASRANA